MHQVREWAAIDKQIIYFLGVERWLHQTQTHIADICCSPKLIVIHLDVAEGKIEFLTQNKRKLLNNPSVLEIF